jgi:hypothetical protein
VANKIVQLVPAAPNWWVHYQDSTGGELESPLALWALVEDDDGQRSIYPVDPSYTDWDHDITLFYSEVIYRPDGPPAESLWAPPPQDGVRPS